MNFWKVNLTGWFVFAITWIILYTPLDYQFKDIFKIFLSNFLIPVLITSSLRIFYNKVSLNEFSLAKIFLIIGISTLISSLLWYFTDTTFTLIYYDYPVSLIKEITLDSFAKRLIGIFILLSLWCTLYFIINLFYQWQSEKEAKERAIYNALESKMEVLKNQINPHFLFNSLNSISALIDENPRKAQLIIDELSSFLRYTLTYKNNVRIDLKREIEFIKHYIYIQSIRFEDNFEFTLKTDPDTESYLIPPAILYPIVENAIKHGMESSNLPLKVSLTTHLKDEHLVICVKNSGDWIKEAERSSSTNSGIKNVRERLICEYGEGSGFYINSQNSWVEVKLIIPLERE
jgi:sensor histidine kinase YesM